MRLPTLTPVSGTILNISPVSRECCSQLISLRTSDGVINLMVTTDTYVMDCARLRAGMRVTGFYNPNAPVPLIFPPQYRAEIIVAIFPNDQVMLDYFDPNLLASNGSLKLNLDNQTNVLTPNGQRYSCNPGGNTLLVLYRATTRSIPPQTTPRKIIVFC